MTERSVFRRRRDSGRVAQRQTHVKVATWNCCNASPSDVADWTEEVVLSCEAEVILLQEPTSSLGSEVAGSDLEDVDCPHHVYHTDFARAAIFVASHLCAFVNWWSGDHPLFERSMNCCAIIMHEIGYVSGYSPDTSKAVELYRSVVHECSSLIEYMRKCLRVRYVVVGVDANVSVFSAGCRHNRRAHP